MRIACMFLSEDRMSLRCQLLEAVSENNIELVTKELQHPNAWETYAKAVAVGIHKKYCAVIELLLRQTQLDELVRNNRTDNQGKKLLPIQYYALTLALQNNYTEVINTILPMVRLSSEGQAYLYYLTMAVNTNDFNMINKIFQHVELSNFFASEEVVYRALAQAIEAQDVKLIKNLIRLGKYFRPDYSFIEAIKLIINEVQNLKKLTPALVKLYEKFDQAAQEQIIRLTNKAGIDLKHSVTLVNTGMFALKRFELITERGKVRPSVLITPAEDTSPQMQLSKDTDRMCVPKIRSIKRR